MGDTILEFGKFAAVPTIGSTYEIAGDTLQTVNVVTTALWANLLVLDGILMAAVHATVAVVVHRTIAHIEFVHQIDHLADSLRIVGSIAIDLDIEDVAATCQIVIRSLYLSLMTDRTLVVNGHMVRVGVVILVGHTRDDAIALLVDAGETSRQTFGRSSKHRVVVLVAIGELADLLLHEGDDLKTKFLSLVTLAMMMTTKGNQVPQSGQLQRECRWSDSDGPKAATAPYRRIDDR